MFRMLVLSMAMMAALVGMAPASSACCHLLSAHVSVLGVCGADWYGDLVFDGLDEWRTDSASAQCTAPTGTSCGASAEGPVYVTGEKTVSDADAGCTGP